MELPVRLLWRRRRRKRNDARKKGVRVRQGDDGAAHPSGASPLGMGVKLLTSAWTEVSDRAQVHQGNEKPGFYYGPRCIVGRTQRKLLVEMDYRHRGEQKRIHMLQRLYSMCSDIFISWRNYAVICFCLKYFMSFF